MDRATLKAQAKERLGGGLFQGNWIMAVVAIIVYSLIYSAVSTTGIGAILLAGPLSFGLNYLFLKQSRDGEKMEIGNLFKGFTEDFVQNFLLGFLSSLFILLWSCLFIIPGIIKVYSYSMCYYIKADHPEYNWKECLDASKELMNGHKMELFTLQLSFLGWAILGSLACGVGTLWVSAYMSATQAEFYKEISGNK